ncbi:hypothetical protein DUNSADRAFT_14299 [Dunaliella salina]|uniref:Uncharacterized protein n=1 Tax=Dunaliella salina TaxID=3046 RepID=A0ABQ7H2N8_DUNSA|nr:hypothetical protein DUNSADRAFT_14299 [Dunaliella salina]|eukprot:KAF5841124.1 hypothetical protein DUNSADRAFT_14299 [Dunaliella salina]
MLCKKGRLLPTQTCLKSTCFSLRRRMAPAVKGLVQVANAHELDSSFSGLRDENGQMTVAGFGSLLSERSARTTFPELQNFRLGKIAGWRRVFAHTADIFYKRGIARPETVICAAWDDEHYKATRCPPEEWHNRWSVHGVQQVWGVPGILPCRVYLRHCVLAAKSMGPLCENSFLDSTFLSDRVTTVRQHLKANPTIMDELPPPELIGRYSG